jgi:hypothetical protein
MTSENLHPCFELVLEVLGTTGSWKLSRQICSGMLREEVAVDIPTRCRVPYSMVACIAEADRATLVGKHSPKWRTAPAPAGVHRVTSLVRHRGTTALGIVCLLYHAVRGCAAAQPPLGESVTLVV